MSPAWWDEVARFVETLETAQQELFDALRQQRRALTEANNAELERLNKVAGDAARRLVEVGAEPTQDGWRVRQLALFEQTQHARVAPGTFLGLDHAVDPPRSGHVLLPLFSPNAPCAHRPTLRLVRLATELLDLMS